MKKKNIAIYLSGVHDIRGGGGAERFFADFFTIYQSYDSRKFNLFFFLDESTLDALKQVNKLNDISNVVVLKNVSNRFKKQLENIDFKIKLAKHKIDLVHCANFGRQDFNRLNYVSHKNKVQTVLNIVDCQVPYVLEDKSDARHSVYQERYVEMPQTIKFTGVFSWYEKFITYFNNNELYAWNPPMKNIVSRFADTKKFHPSSTKEKTIVFASRMHFQKRPDWYLKAIKILNDQDKIPSEWKFILLGDGELSKEMEDYILENKLGDVVNRKLSEDLSTIYPTTSCYVSTQDFENFPSLSMMEAMACGNAVIARNVGQTNLMVRNGVNGFLLEEDSPEGLAHAIEKYICLSDQEQSKMQAESLKMVKEVHTPLSFIHQIEDFWVTLLKQDK